MWFPILMAGNALWLGCAFGYFAVTPHNAAKLITARERRGDPLFATLRASLPFLGGMNLALAALALGLLVLPGVFPTAAQRALLTGVLALAHGSQFAGNLPIAAAERRGEAPWTLRRGLMRFIFVVDGSLMVANALAAGSLLSQASMP